MKKKSANQSSLNLVVSIFKKLEKRRKLQVGLTFIFMFISGLAEMINLTAVVPFLILLTNPDKVFEYPIIKNLGYLFVLKNASELILPSTLFFALTALIAGLIKVISLWLNTKLSSVIGNDISKEVYKKTLLQPYSSIIKSNSADLINSITNNIFSTVKVIERSLAILSAFIVMTNLIIGLIIFNYSITFSVIIILFSVYITISYFTKIKLKSNSKKLTQNTRDQIKLSQESLGAIKDIIIFNSKNIYLDIYGKIDKRIRNLYAQNSFLGAYPKSVIESFSLIILILSSLLLRSKDGFREDTIVVMGLFALAAQKLIPNMQMIYSSLSSIRSNTEQARKIVDVLNKDISKQFALENFKKIEFKRNIKFENISFCYPDKGLKAIKNFNFEIFKGEKIGVMGPTGSGKSTFINIILGLLKPSKGLLLVDGKDIHDPYQTERLRKWQNSITYVPQSIYLVDSSIKENIAYGVPPELIDMDLIKRCAKYARINDFIESKEGSYESLVGERGIKLSGGQIQRIGIARALYKRSKIFIFDEATSALDFKTELEVINSIYDFDKSSTIILVTHRLNTIANCDRIIEIENSEIKKVILGNQLSK